jgi:hypothetical protein
MNDNENKNRTIGDELGIIKNNKDGKLPTSGTVDRREAYSD